VSAFLFEQMEIRKIKCGADERRHRRLDGGDPLFSPKVKMQTNLQRVTKKADTPSGYLLFYLNRWRFERLNAARTSAATDGLTEVILYFHQR